MEGDSDAERNEVLCLNSDPLENVYIQVKAVESDITNFKKFLSSEWDVFLKVRHYWETKGLLNSLSFY